MEIHVAAADAAGGERHARTDCCESVGLAAGTGVVRPTAGGVAPRCPLPSLGRRRGGSASELSAAPRRPRLSVPGYGAVRFVMGDGHNRDSARPRL